MGKHRSIRARTQKYIRFLTYLEKNKGPLPQTNACSDESTSSLSQYHPEGPPAPPCLHAQPTQSAASGFSQKQPSPYPNLWRSMASMRPPRQFSNFGLTRTCVPFGPTVTPPPVPMLLQLRKTQSVQLKSPWLLRTQPEPVLLALAAGVFWNVMLLPTKCP